jgi:hypothetical protein
MTAQAETGESKGNGVYPGSTGTSSKYGPDDFSQQAINRGQRRINFELVVVTHKLADALDKLIERLSPGDKEKYKDVGDLVATARKIANAVADIRPPGCDPPSTNPNPTPS